MVTSVLNTMVTGDPQSQLALSDLRSLKDVHVLVTPVFNMKTGDQQSLNYNHNMDFLSVRLAWMLPRLGPSRLARGRRPRPWP